MTSSSSFFPFAAIFTASKSVHTKKKNVGRLDSVIYERRRKRGLSRQWYNCS
eukprot:m.155844 g.155844  ORF g.155844 m.155844 type:complete len:52 (+) comp30955_c0_seq8:1195-1350(+)